MYILSFTRDAEIELGIVVNECFLGNASVLRLARNTVNELLLDILWIFLASDHMRVLGTVIQGNHFVQIHTAGSFMVQSAKCSV